MRYYVITESRVAVLRRQPKTVASGAIVVRSTKDLDQKRFPVARLVALWNALPSVEPVKRFASRPGAVSRIWSALEKLPISSGRTDSKQAKIIAMLQRPNGASIEEMVSASGWKPHSVRGLLSGVLRKKLGLTVILATEGKRHAYRVAA